MLVRETSLVWLVVAIYSESDSSESDSRKEYIGKYSSC